MTILMEFSSQTKQKSKLSTVCLYVWASVTDFSVSFAKVNCLDMKLNHSL